MKPEVSFPFRSPLGPARPASRSFAALWRVGVLVLALCMPAGPSVGSTDERSAVPGNYAIGFYADFEATSREIVLPKGEDRFELFIGLQGDSTRVFSGLVFRVELPFGLELDGPITWRPLPGLRQSGAVEVGGAEVNFHETCVETEGDRPVIVGRMAMRMSPELKQVSLDPLRHRAFGLSVELCQPEKGFPKPYATGLGIVVKREQSFWDRITSWFD